MIKIDEKKNVLIIEDTEGSKEIDLGSKEGFGILSKLWLRAGWDTKYVYSFSWLGRPIIQLPEDILRIQEVIYTQKPDVVIETGVAHGGSLVFYASLFQAMGRGRVIGVDIEIRPHNRKAIEEHELFHRIELIEGSSIDENVINSVRTMLHPDEKVLVILDSNHTKDHVLSELKRYSEFVSNGSYLIVCDGIMADVVGAPRTNEDWSWNNPKEAVYDFIKHDDHFIIEEPVFPFNEGEISERVTYWPSAFLKRVR